jgi:hypothetical protein
MDRTFSCSRRTFLAVGAAGALSGLGGTSSIASGSGGRTAESVPSDVSRFDQAGYPSRIAERAWAEEEYRHQQRMDDEFAQEDDPGSGQNGDGPGSPTSPNFGTIVNAVDDLGADPSGNRPISQDIGSGIQPGTLIVFPPGKYLLTGKLDAIVDGKVGLVGTGYEKSESPPKPGGNAATFVAVDNTRAAVNIGGSTGLLANFVFDQTGNNNSISILMESSGFVQSRDIRFIGTQDNTGSQADEDQSDAMCRFLTEEGTTARAERVVGSYIGLPGDKNSGGAPFFWVGQGNRGTAQMGHCVSQGAADNGLYGGRTPGKAQVKDGTYRNNAVSQLRYDGVGSFADGVTMVVDADNYKGPTNGVPYNEKFGVQGLKIERRKFQNKKPSGTVLRNADVRVKSINSNMGAPIFVRGWGGALKIENCRIVNHLDQPTIVAEKPGSGNEATRPPHNISITDSEIVGSNAESVIKVVGRENSLIKDTCIRVPGAGPDSISGMRIGSGVGFGEQCSAGGLKAPDKVGSAGNLSSVSVPNGSFSSGSDVERLPYQEVFFSLQQRDSNKGGGLLSSFLNGIKSTIGGALLVIISGIFMVLFTGALILCCSVVFLYLIYKIFF